MEAWGKTAPTPSNYGYTLRRAKGAPWVAHSSRNISLRSIFPLRPDTAQIWKIQKAPCRDVLDQIRPAAGLRISYFVMRNGLSFVRVTFNFLQRFPVHLSQNSDSMWMHYFNEWSVYLGIPHFRFPSFATFWRSCWVNPILNCICHLPSFRTGTVFWLLLLLSLFPHLLMG